MGLLDPNTREFIDGVLPNLYRNAAADTTPDLKFVLFDGPVDAIWIENMNTVLDDNRKPSGTAAKCWVCLIRCP